MRTFAEAKRSRGWCRTEDGRWFCPKPECKAKCDAPVETVKVFDMIGNLHAVYDAFHADFQRYFQAPLRKFWDPIMGLDVVKLDEEIVKSGDGHMLQIVSRRFGRSAADLLRRLMDAEKNGVEVAAKLP